MNEPKNPEQIMINLLRRIYDEGITNSEMIDFYVQYQKNWHKKHNPDMNEETLQKKAYESTIERLSDRARRRKLGAVQTVINERRNDFICDFLAMITQQEFEKNGIESKAIFGADSYVLTKRDAFCPGHEWAEITGKELRCDTSMLMGADFNDDEWSNYELQLCETKPHAINSLEKRTLRKYLERNGVTKSYLLDEDIK